MTVRVITLKGAGAGDYYLRKHSSYYLDPDEPSGRWRGSGATLLGLQGELDGDAFVNVMAGRDPEGVWLLGRRYHEESVRGFDVTFSAPKSVSLLWALGDDPQRAHVAEAHDAAVDAVLGWIERHALTRITTQRSVSVVDAEGIIAAVFRQHTSRALDPQLHTHAVIANRVMAPNGRWLALDARGLKVDQRTLSALYHAGLRAELTTRLGVAWDAAVNGIAEIAGFPVDLREHFSSRTADVNNRFAVKLDRFTASYGREPSLKERWQLEREAVTDSRPTKPHGPAPETLTQQWMAATREAGHVPTSVIASVVGREPGIASIDPRSLMATATASLSERQSSWRPAEIVREVAATLPTNLATSAGTAVAASERLADAMTAAMVDISPPIPHGVPRRRDGRPVTESVLDNSYTTNAILGQEQALEQWAHRRLQISPTPDDRVEHFATVELDHGQRRLAAAIAGDAPLVLAIGPAGTGKTTAIKPGVELLQATGRAVFGVAPSAAAAKVLADETGIDADTIDKLLHEHANGPAARYRLPAGTTVIVDEAAMVSTPNLAEFADLADRHQWRVVLVGDPHQFSAVGRGGIFSWLTSIHEPIALGEVHRFANGWEAEASLALRAGDPEALAVYERNGRIHAGSPSLIVRQVFERWEGERDAGRDVLLIASTNEFVRELNTAAQLCRIERGELSGPPVRASGYDVLVGDHVVTRLNNRYLNVCNRETWTVAATLGDGALTVASANGRRVRLPNDYVVEHVELAYTQTAHASQGRTVDTTITVMDKPTDARGVYVPMTRGRHENHVYVPTTGRETALDLLSVALTRTTIDEPATQTLRRRTNDAAELLEHWRRVERASPRLAAVPAPALRKHGPVVDHSEFTLGL